MKILVTGATGFLGSHTAAALIAAGHDVRVLARTPAKVATVMAPFDVEIDDIVEGDMTDRKAVATATEGRDAVVHAAAEIGVAGGGGQSATANIDGSKLVIETAIEHGCDPIIYTSTIGAYLPTEDATITLDTPLARPLSSYSAQKIAVEEIVRDLQVRNHPVTSFVIGGIYGPQSPHLDSSFAALISSLEMGMMAPKDTGMGVIDVRDLAAMIVKAVRPGRGPRRFLATGQFITWQRWAEVLSEATGREVPFTDVSAADMLTLGKEFDVMRANGETVPPLSEEAAILMCSGRPGDDAPTLEELQISYRPLVDTFRDAVTWLANR